MKPLIITAALLASTSAFAADLPRSYSDNTYGATLHYQQRVAPRLNARLLRRGCRQEAILQIQRQPCDSGEQGVQRTDTTPQASRPAPTPTPPAVTPPDVPTHVPPTPPEPKPPNVDVPKSPPLPQGCNTSCPPAKPDDSPRPRPDVPNPPTHTPCDDCNPPRDTDHPKPTPDHPHHHGPDKPVGGKPHGDKPVGNPGNGKPVGHSGEKPGKGFNAPVEGGPGTKGRSDGDKAKGKAKGEAHKAGGVMGYTGSYEPPSANVSAAPSNSIGQTGGGSGGIGGGDNSNAR